MRSMILCEQHDYKNHLKSVRSQSMNLAQIKNSNNLRAQKTGFTVMCYKINLITKKILYK